jgi:hypothetical protein
MKNGSASTRFLAFILVAIAIAGPGAAEQPVYTTRTSVDWSERVLRIDVSLDLSAAGLRLPEGRLDAERMIERDIAALAKDAVFSLQADSYRTVEDAVSDGTIDPEALVALAGLVHAESSAFSKDMRRFLASYSLGLDAVASLFLSGAGSSPIRAPLETAPTRDYTGIVIYAKGSLPVHGEAVEDRAEPCLFPRVYDSEMNLVVDRRFVAPEELSAAGGGVLGYASAIGAEAGRRIGTDPMRVMAIGLFGDRRTDYIISREDALRILSSAGNRELLRQGKVLVVH